MSSTTAPAALATALGKDTVPVVILVAATEKVIATETEIVIDVVMETEIASAAVVMAAAAGVVVMAAATVASGVRAGAVFLAADRSNAPAGVGVTVNLPD